MKDLEGKELEVGSLYYILGSGSRVVISRYSHETEFSFVFKPIKGKITNMQNEPVIYIWKRVLNKWWSSSTMIKSLAVIKVSQEVLDKYQMS